MDEQILHEICRFGKTNRSDVDIVILVERFFQFQQCNIVLPLSVLWVYFDFCNLCVNNFRITIIVIVTIRVSFQVPFTKPSDYAESSFNQFQMKYGSKIQVEFYSSF